ncbi:uncharacterized protein LOC124693306 [Lolium rigidum]|uniref:uncharacterized protein LOC124693306 n=1 Tax=Lolium rigidum TaxID=89674 RepID=UPI001F5CB8DB|nr:uncharacterized protein LOC124693306 [Lolium rigidum]
MRCEGVDLMLTCVMECIKHGHGIAFAVSSTRTGRFSATVTELHGQVVVGSHLLGNNAGASGAHWKQLAGCRDHINYYLACLQEVLMMQQLQGGPVGWERSC